MKTGKIEEIRIEEIEEMETDTMSKLEKVFDTPNKKAFIGYYHPIITIYCHPFFIDNEPVSSTK